MVPVSAPEYRPRRAWRSPRLRSRLFLLVAAVAVPLLLLTFVAMLSSYRGDRARAEDRLQDQARALATVVDREIARVRAVLEALATSSALADRNLADFDLELHDAAMVLHGTPIALVDADNRMELNTRWPAGAPHAVVPSPAELAAPLRTGLPMVSDLRRSSISGEWVISVVVPVERPDRAGKGLFRGELAAALPAAALARTLSAQALPPGWVAAVVDRANRVAARSVEHDRFVGSDVLPEMRAAITSHESGLVRTRRVDGVHSSLAFVHAPDTGFALVLAAPDETFVGPLRRELWRTLAGGAVLSMAGLGLAVLMARRLAASIASLADPSAPLPVMRLWEVEQTAALLARTAAERDAAQTRLRAMAEGLERQVAERTAAYARSEAELRAVFDSQFQTITLLSPDGRRLQMNRAMRQMRGPSADGLIGQYVWDAPWWRANAEGAAVLRRAVARAAAGESVRFEDQTVAEDGPRVLDMSIRPVRDPVTGSVRMLVAEGHDITEVRALQERMAQTSRLEALGQLAGGVAHDFNNVLQAVASALTLISRRAEDPPTVRRMAELAIDSVARGAAVTRRMLSFARRDSLQPEPVPPAELLAGLEDVLTHTMGPGLRLELDAPPDLPPVLADRPQLEAVLVNLATNARDAIRDRSGGGQGRLRLVARETVEPAETAAAASPGRPTLKPGRYIRLDAIDDGAGMDAATLRRAMEPFFTTKPTGQGTGLGLAMARGFAEQSGGGLAIASVPGQGTTVSLWLPSADGRAQAKPPTWPAPALQAPAGRHILLADDSQPVREMLAHLLETMGHTVTQAADAEQALAQLTAAQAPGIDLVITDLTMPGMSGLDLIRAAQAHRPGLPAILLTGYAGDIGDTAQTARMNGPFRLLHKPVPLPLLTECVTALLDQAAPPVQPART